MAGYAAAMHDVVVIGGSLAGAATAIHLARHGRSVLIVDRAVFPRRKACGEGLFPYGVAELERLGIPSEVLAETVPLRELRFHAGHATAVAPIGGAEGLGIRREVLDAAVLSLAANCGVEIRTGVTVNGLVTERGRVATLDTSQGAIGARAFVAADGLQSRMRRLAGLDGFRVGSRYGVSAHVVLPRAPEPAVDVFFHDGYEVYRTPIGARTANVAILLEKPQMARFAGRLAEAYRMMLQDHPAIGTPVQLEDAPLAAGPFPRDCWRSWRGNLVLVGDAAGFFDGISGDGMSAALVTARLCASAVGEFLNADGYDAFRAYETRHRRVGRNANLLARLSLSLARRPAAARFAVRNMERQPQTFARLVEIGAGGAGLRSLRPRDLLALTLGL